VALVVVVVLAIGGAVLYYQQGPCGVARVKAGADAMTKLGKEWDDANKIAGSTGRGSLSSPVATLQRIARDADDLKLPGCMSETKAYMESYMSNTIDGYILFMGQLSSDSTITDSQVNYRFDQATAEFNLFDTALTSVQKCAPFCK
jgi:hypothetical protein